MQKSLNVDEVAEVTNVIISFAMGDQKEHICYYAFKVLDR